MDKGGGCNRKDKRVIRFKAFQRARKREIGRQKEIETERMRERETDRDIKEGLCQQFINANTVDGAAAWRYCIIISREQKALFKTCDKFPAKQVRRDEINGTNKNLEAITVYTRHSDEYQR